MYDIRQFKPVLYLVVILGLTGFAVAAEEPVLWILSVSAVLLNAALVWRKKFTPMPRWVANLITLASMAYVLNQVIRWTTTPILLIGQFLVLLQIVKLFEQRANRDYAQLLILGLLLMVAAAISTASLTFAVLLVAYILLALYCCLLFHLKVETDRAKAAQTLPAEKLNVATLRQDQRYLGRSMRRLTAMVSVVAMMCAVFVFLFTPRGTGAGMLGQFQLRPPEVLTGFSDEVQLNEVARITQNNTPVATVRVEHNGQLVQAGSLYLRGATFQVYEKAGPGGGERRWSPGVPHRRPSGRELTPLEIPAGETQPLTDPVGIEEWHQVVRLDPIGARALFSLAGPTRFKPARDVKILFHSDDQTLQRTDNLNIPLEYEVESCGRTTMPPSQYMQMLQTPRDRIPKEIVDFADAVVPRELRDRRPFDAIPTVVDAEIARTIESYFKVNFGYTLDLTDDASLFEGKDPLAVFVSQTKRGHCEYFAGAMVLACQSLGLKARMVTGFMTDEYNRYSEIFQVRESHAHAWVEVLTADKGWVTFDPTSGREFPPNESRSAWRRVKHVFEWMEYKWASSVVAYDGTRRDNLVQQLDTSLVKTAYRSQDKINRLSRWWDAILGGSEFWTVSAKILAGVITCMGLVIVAAIAWYLYERRRIRRRAARIGLDNLPVNEQIRLARQLGFYEDVIEALRRRDVRRPAHLTPQEFSRTLSFLPVEAYETIERLTRIYYRVRYGGARVQAAQQHRLGEAVRRLNERLPDARL
jgi:transglutaminase-like putative cysteine protease